MRTWPGIGPADTAGLRNWAQGQFCFPCGKPGEARPPGLMLLRSLPARFGPGCGAVSDHDAGGFHRPILVLGAALAAGDDGGAMAMRAPEARCDGGINTCGWLPASFLAFIGRNCAAFLGQSRRFRRS